MLVGNFGNGRINAFNLATGAFLGHLSNPAGQPISIDGLWGLAFGNGDGGHGNTLFLAAGLNDEADGLFGTLTPTDQHDPGGRAASDPGHVGLTGQAGTFTASLSPLAQAPSLAVLNSLATPTLSPTGTRAQSTLLPRSSLFDAVLVGPVSREVIDHAFGNLQPSPTAQVFALGLADALAH